MDYKGQNQSTEKMFDFGALKRVQGENYDDVVDGQEAEQLFKYANNPDILMGEHDSGKIGNAALNSNNIFTPEEIVSIENADNINDFVPATNEGQVDAEKVSNPVNIKLDEISTGKTITKKTMEQINTALSDFKKNNNPAAFVDNVYNMTEANLENSYGRKLGDVN